MKYFSWIVIALVAVIIVAGFFVVGSPMHQRLVRLDERRLSDLQYIQNQISSYFAAKGKLPEVLDDMKGFEGFSGPIMDPESGANYEYAKKDAMRFELCANFSLASEENSVSQPMWKSSVSTNDNWKHPAGRGCFEIVLEKNVSGSNYAYPLTTVKPAI